jgi:sigma-54 specific flagellar transcriptional regulator A
MLNKQMEEDSECSVQLSPEAMASIMQHQWPGNVRELSNLVERLGIMFPDASVLWDDLPEKYQYDISHIDELPTFNECLNKTPLEEIEGIDTSNTPEVLSSDNSQPEVVSAPTAEQLPDEGFDLKNHLANLEYSLIQQALKESDGVVAHAAKRLNMRRTTLVEKLKKYDALFSS